MACDSLQTAFHNLLDRYGLPYEKLQLKDADWHAVSDFDGRISVSEIGQGGTWPHTNDAIVQFQFQSPDEPYIDIDGFQRANMIDVYCLLADGAQRLCVVADGGIEEIPGYYGNPVAWASYDADVKRKPAKESNLHKVLAGESIWTIAQRFKIPAPELIEHNDIEDAANIPAGTILRLPYAKPVKEDIMITYELFDVPRTMHIAKQDGAKKFSFGNAREWKDIRHYGHTYPEHANVDIAAIAHVPIREDGREVTAKYYMDAASVGSYKDTGRVNSTTGFNHLHLAYGAYKAPEPTPAEEPRPLPNVPEEVKNPDLFKTTYQPFAEPRLYTANDAISVVSADGRGTGGILQKDRGVWISGTFTQKNPEGEEIEYYRVKPGQHDYWYRIRTDLLRPYEEEYNYGVDIKTKIAIKRKNKELLSPSELAFVAFSRAAAGGTKLKTAVKKFKTKGA